MLTPQTPIDSGFDLSHSAADVIKGIDLRGKIAIVSGGYSGIGLETTRALAGAGASVIVPARSLDKARMALDGIDRVELAPLDLIDPASIEAFANQFLATHRPLDLLINNAGVMALPLTRDARGYEMHLSANHLGPFELTARLWPALTRARTARVVTLSSGAHRRAAIDFDDLHYERRDYDKWGAYGQSKTAGVLFTVALDAFGKPHGVRAFAVHPGRIETDLQRHITLEELQKQGFRDTNGQIPEDQRKFYKSIGQGAATTVWCATSPLLEGKGGVYCEDINVAQAVPADYKPLNGVLPWAIDPDDARRLWLASEAMTGVAFV
ncbi:putative oxidoreductase [Pararobbsia alpina]|uniref:oxidoreductase n=1 Tax=Pararobbsia alpina TaxID=621374 RepID=UPI0039A40AC5